MDGVLGPPPTIHAALGRVPEQRELLRYLATASQPNVVLLLGKYQRRYMFSSQHAVTRLRSGRLIYPGFRS